MKNKIILLFIVLLPLFFTAQNKISLTGCVGYAWRIGEIPSNVSRSERDFRKGLKSGMNYDLAGYYRVNHQIGLGLKYNLYTTSSSGAIDVRNEHGNTENVRVTTNDKITFVGPSMLYSNFSMDTKHKLYYDMALGVISYKSIVNNATVTGSNVGLAGSLGYKYVFSPRIYVGPQVSYTAGVLKKIKVNGVTRELPEDEMESLHRFAASAGITVRL